MSILILFMSFFHYLSFHFYIIRSYLSITTMKFTVKKNPCIEPDALIEHLPRGTIQNPPALPIFQ